MSYGTRLVRRSLGTWGHRKSRGVLGAALDASAQATAQLIRWRQGAAGLAPGRGESPSARFVRHVAGALEAEGWLIRVGLEDRARGGPALIGDDPWGTRHLLQCVLGEGGMVDVDAVYAAAEARDRWACDRSGVVAPDGVRFTHTARDYARGADVSLMHLSGGELVRAAP